MQTKDKAALNFFTDFDLPFPGMLVDGDCSKMGGGDKGSYYKRFMVET